MRTPQTLTGRIVILFGVLAIFVGLAVGGAFALGFGPWADGGGEQADNDEPFIPASRGEEDVVIAEVDGTPIGLLDAEARIEGFASMHGDAEETLGPNWPETVLQSLVDDVLLLAEADQRGIVVTEGDVDRSISRIEGMLQSEEAFADWLEEQGKTLPELERTMWLQIVAARVYNALTEDVSTTAAELRAYYREHRDEYRSAEGWVVPFISVRDELQENMLKEKQDEAYADWLETARAEADVVVLEEDWWRDVG